MNIEKIILYIIALLIKVKVIEIDSFKLNIKPTSPVYWINNQEILVNEKDKSYVYDIKQREKQKEFKKKSNQVVGYKDDKYLICEWENRSIDSSEQFSTHLKQTTEDGKILQDLELKPTLEVIECREEIILRTVYPLEEKFYFFDSDLFEIEEYKENILSPNLTHWLSTDDFNNYWINKITFFQLF
jgi:hypothetical protein